MTNYFTDEEILQMLDETLKPETLANQLAGKFNQRLKLLWDVNEKIGIARDEAKSKLSRLEGVIEGLQFSIKEFAQNRERY